MTGYLYAWARGGDQHQRSIRKPKPNATIRRNQIKRIFVPQREASKVKE